MKTRNGRGVAADEEKRLFTTLENRTCISSSLDVYLYI